MIIITKEIPNTNFQFTPPSIDLSKSLFFDIETTGFSKTTTSLYLIGCIYFDKNIMQSIQWFLETVEDEKQLLCTFQSFLTNIDKTHLICFNGLQFDIPYLESKFAIYDMPSPFSDFVVLDLYRKIAPYKKFLKLENVKQKTLEQFLGEYREDSFSGQELISIYKNYTLHPTDCDLQLLLLHNLEDIIGLFKLLPLLSYTHLEDQPFEVLKTTIIDQQLIFTIEFPFKVPCKISFLANDCYFTFHQSIAKLSVSIRYETLKYFYPNYQDYFYLLNEDRAIHKSVGTYVDSQFRKKAKASNCYIKQTGSFLPQYETLFLPALQRDYSDKSFFFQLSDGFLDREDDVKMYVAHLLKYITVSTK